MIHIQGLILLSSIVLGTLVVTQRISKNGAWQAFFSRKALHVSGVGALSMAPLVIFNDLMMIGLVAIITLLLFFAIKRHWLGVDLYNRPSWGIALFPVSFLILWLWWGRENLDLVMYPMLVLTLADAGAACVGKLVGSKPYNLTGDPKTLVGSITFFFLCAAILIGMPFLLPKISGEIRFSWDEYFLSPLHFPCLL